MVTVDEAIIAKFDKDGKHFEVLVDSELAYGMKEGKIVSLSKMLAVNQVFIDSKKGTRASDKDVSAAFGTTDMEKIAEHIVKHGDLQLTTEFRRKKTEERKRQIASFISKYAIDPRTKTPHPMERVLNAMEQAHVSVDPLKHAEQQVEAAIKAINHVLPVSIEETTFSIQIPAKYANRALGTVKGLGSITEQKWLADGSLSLKLKIPSGMKDKVYHTLGSVTEGNAKVIEG